jgi:hypothetical protein
MNDIDSLIQRAETATKAAGHATIAKRYVECALLEANADHLAIAIRDDLNKAIAAIDRAIKHAEQCRRRLLRKADRKAAKQATTA